MENKILNKILEKLDTIDARLDTIDGRLDTIDGRLDSMDERFDTIDGRLDSMDERFDAMDGRLDAMDKRFDAMDEEIAIIKRSTLIMEQDHGKKLDLLLELNQANYDDHESFKMQFEKLEETSYLHSLEIELLKKAK